MAAPRSTTRRRYLTNFDYRYNEHVTLRAWWRIRFVFSGGNLVVAQVAQLHRTEAQAVLCLRRPALVKLSLMRRVRIIRIGDNTPKLPSPAAAGIRVALTA